ncbi:hypothetical protein BVRB_040990, partial [Beta vulgaris subsp. vulgaris]
GETIFTERQTSPRMAEVSSSPIHHPSSPVPGRDFDHGDLFPVDVGTIRQFQNCTDQTLPEPIPIIKTSGFYKTESILANGAEQESVLANAIISTCLLLLQKKE